MTHTRQVNDIAELEQQLEDAKLEAAIRKNGPFERHARLKVDRLKRDITSLHRRETIVDITDDHPDFSDLD